MSRPDPRRSAPGTLGAFALALIFTLAACRKEASVPEWTGETVATESAAGHAASPAPRVPESRPAPSGSGLRVLSYNVKNWLTMDRYVDGKPVGETTKPDAEKDATVALIAAESPDIVGISEIGTTDDLEDLRQRLLATGLELPHSHYAHGSDDTRRLGLLSRFPILSTEIHGDLNYELDGRRRGMGRGILDATVDTPLGPVRFLGVHLKSKREVPDGDQEMMRRGEAQLLRIQADRILGADPDTRLIVFGDFNDMRQSSVMRTVQGPRNSPLSLIMIPLRDSRGEFWTHHWSYQDVYSRFDYKLVSASLTGRIDRELSRVIDDPSWSVASDHRALLLVLK